MKIKIRKLHSEEMFPDIIMGGPKEGMYEDSLERIKKIFQGNLPIFNLSETKWLQLVDSQKGKIGYGTWGHITGAEVDVVDGTTYHSLVIIFNFYSEVDNIQRKITEVISSIDYQNKAYVWDISDL
jgi:hypothetical protein